MAVIEDLIVNRLVLEGIPGFQSGFGAVDRVMELFGRRVDETDRQLGKMGVTAGLAIGLFGYLAKASRAAAEDQANYARATGNFKGAFPADEMADFTEQTRRLTGVSDDTTTGVLGLLGTFQATKQEAKELLLPILNATEALRAQGVTAEQTAVQVGKALQTGNAQSLRRIGIIVDNPKGFESASQEERARMLADALQRQGGDAALRFRQSMEGATNAVKAGFGEIDEAIGDGLVRPLTGGLNLVAELQNRFLDLNKATNGGLGRGVGNVLGDMIPILLAVSIRSGMAVVETRRLAAENTRLTNEALKSGSAMAKEATEAERLALSLAKASSGTVRLADASKAATTQAAAAPAGAPTGRGRFNMNTALGLGLAADMALQFLPETGGAGTFKHIGESALMGGMTGAMFGPWGALIGAAGGAGLGYMQDQQLQKAGGENKTVEMMQKTIDQQQKMIELLSDIKRNGGPFDTSDIPGSLQVAHAL